MALGTMQNYARAVVDGAIQLMYKYGIGKTTWEKAIKEVIDSNIAIITYVSRLSGREWNKFQGLIKKELNKFQRERKKYSSNPKKVKPLYQVETLEEELATMQDLVNSGQAWHLEGAVGRRAMDLIRQGYIMLGTKGHRDAYGNYVPSRFEVKAGTQGSKEYVEKMAGKREFANNPRIKGITRYRRNPDKVDKIIKDIISGKDRYFGLRHFHSSNMADYTLMETTIEDMVAVYGIDEMDAVDIIQALTPLASKRIAENPKRKKYWSVKKCKGCGVGTDEPSGLCWMCRHKRKKYASNPQWWYLYLKPTPEEEARGFHTLLKVRKQTKYMGWGDEDRARAYAHSIGRKLAGGYTYTTKTFSLDPHKIITVPKGVKPMKRKPDVADLILAYETGELDDKGILKLFSHLIKTGQVWGMQGSLYGRPAKQLIDRGYISPKGEILKMV